MTCLLILSSGLLAGMVIIALLIFFTWRTKINEKYEKFKNKQDLK